jgi:hypothetical protein
MKIKFEVEYDSERGDYLVTSPQMALVHSGSSYLRIKFHENDGQIGTISGYQVDDYVDRKTMESMKDRCTFLVFCIYKNYEKELENWRKANELESREGEALPN